MAISSPQKANKLKLNLRNIEEKNYRHTHTHTKLYFHTHHFAITARK